MVDTGNIESRSKLEQHQFEALTWRHHSRQRFEWQDYVTPNALPAHFEEREWAMRKHETPAKLARYTEDLQRSMRSLKKGWRDRELSRIDNAVYDMRSAVRRLRRAYLADSPHRPLPPHWKQFAERVRTAKPQYYLRVGYAFEGLAWAQSLDDYFELEPQPPRGLGPHLRDWGRCFAAEPLSWLRAGHERRTVGLLHRFVTPEKLALRAQTLAQCVQDALDPRSHNANLLIESAAARRQVFFLRVTLLALHTPADLLPARRSQFRLAGGDHQENGQAWLRHVGSWCQCRLTSTGFSQTEPLRLAPHELGLCDLPHAIGIDIAY